MLMEIMAITITLLGTMVVITIMEETNKITKRADKITTITMVITTIITIIKEVKITTILTE